MAWFFNYALKIIIMATDNPNKKKADAKRISQQPHEQAYQTRKKKAARSATQPKKTNSR
jgi:hypothetical protein